jgi:hypothetical protein
MIRCEKRQTVVKRSEGLTILRCMNKRCGMHAQEVNEDVCSRCPTPVVKHKRPCDKTPVRSALPPATPQEVIDVTDPEVIEMIKDAGIHVGDIEKAQTKIIGEGEVPPGYPPISMQLWTYKEALIKWHKAGRPKRTQEEVERIHSTFCASGCEWYDEEAKRCKGCGCAVTVGSLAVLNKIKMGTEHCPKDRW